MSGKGRRKLLRWFRDNVDVIRWISVIAGFIPVLREAISGTADIVQLFTSLGGVLSLGIFLWVFVLTVVVSVILPKREYLSDSELPSSAFSSKSRTFQRRHERERLADARKTTFGLMIIAAVQAVSVGALLLRNSSTLSLDTVIASFIEQIELKERETANEFFMPVIPSTGSRIYMWEMFDPTQYSIGDQLKECARGLIVVDPTDPGNLACQYTVLAGRGLTVSANRGSSPSSGNAVFQFRIKVLTLSSDESVDTEIQLIPGNLDTTVDEVIRAMTDGLWHTITLYATTTSVESRLDGEVIDVNSNDGETNSLPETMEYEIQFRSGATVLIDDILLWANPS